MPTYSNTTLTTKPRADLQRLAALPTYEAENEAYIRQLRDAGLCDYHLFRLDPWIEEETFIGDDVDPEVILAISNSQLTPRRQAKAFDWIVACEITRLDLVKNAIEVFVSQPIVLGNRRDPDCSSFEQSRFRGQAPYHQLRPSDWKYGRLPLNALERISAEQSGTLESWDREFPSRRKIHGPHPMPTALPRGSETTVGRRAKR